MINTIHRILICIILLINPLMMMASVNDSLKLSEDMTVIRGRMLAPYRQTPDMIRVNQWQRGLATDGSWLDIDYADTSTTAWKPVEHLRRILTLTQAWYAPSSPFYRNTQLHSDISRALDYWFRRDPRRLWWWDSIGAPGTMGWILLMLDESLSSNQLEQGIKVLDRAVLGTTGQNLVWQAEITARRAILKKNKDLLMQAFELIASEIRLGDGEGIQADFSFHQHGHCLYNHGYGAGFAEDNAKLASLTAGTLFEYKPDKITLLSSLILDGSQWFALGPVSDYAAEGRELTRPAEDAGYLGDAAKYMLTLSTGREKEFRSLLARIQGEPAEPLTGNKHFFRSDIMVHRRPHWYMSAKMYSNRMFNTDGLSGCDEGLLSHYLAEGATTIMRNGSEYRDIFPVWDWQRIPGTTIELKSHLPGEPKRRGTTAFAGGASDGLCGAAGFQLRRDSLSARKAWFFFSDAAVCLGSGIHCDTDFPVVTTINQCLLKGPVLTGENKSKRFISEGEHKINVRWVIHDSITYLFDKPTEAIVNCKEQSGSWKRISAQKSGVPVTEKVFTLGLDHGPGPEGAVYACGLIPGTEEKDIEGILNKPSYTIVFNNEALQAVYHLNDSVMGIVFHEAGQLKWQKWSIETDRPCILILRREKEVWKMAIADPSAGTGTVHLKLKLPREKAKMLEVNLPDGLYAGSSKLLIVE